MYLITIVLSVLGVGFVHCSFFIGLLFQARDAEPGGRVAEYPFYIRGLNLQAKSESDRALKVWMVFLPRIVVGTLMLIVAFTLVSILIKTKEENKMKPPGSNALVVRTIEVVHQSSSRVWSGYGTVQSMASIDVVAEVGGRVIERPESIEAGRKIKKGDLIVGLDDVDFVNALEAAQSAAKSLEAQLMGLHVEDEQLRTQIVYVGEEIEAAQRDLDRTDEAIEAGA